MSFLPPEEVEKGIRRIFALIRKELDSFIRDKSALLMLFISPILMMYLISNIQVTNFMEQPTVYIIDDDQSPLSLKFIESLENDSRIQCYDNIHNPNFVTLTDAERLITTSYLNSYILIPDNFSTNLIKYRTANITTVINGIDPLEAFEVRWFITIAILQFQETYQVFNSEIIIFPVTRPNDSVNEILLFAPLMTPILLFGANNMVASQSVVNDKPLKRMLLSPVRKFEVLAGKFWAYSFFGAILTLGMSILGWVLYDLPIVSFFDTFVVLLSITIFGITFGILFSCLSSTQIQAAEMFAVFLIFQLLIIVEFRIDPFINFMPIEIVRKLFIDVGYRGIPLLETRWFNDVVGYNLIVFGLAIIVFWFKKVEF